MPNNDTKRFNRLLGALPEADFERLKDQLRTRDGQQKYLLAESGDPINEVYFPVDAVVSVLTRMDDGASVEIATIGNEGLVGVSVAWGADTMNPKEFATVQVPGTIVSMDREAFRQEVQRQGPLASLVERYTQAFFTQVSQQVACNGLHSVEQRCARWLLLTQDRAGTDEFPMTHEFLAQMLGVRRATVTVTAGILQKAGFVQFTRGRVAIVDREGLEDAACECYAVTREVYERLLP
ncbi:MAG TPA: Crp/Fnr family transcriptional regulator [Acidimicrobiia bacterium]|nr:Crp/Fnr family transcriptional regulator [Acidimicrobiia bacterium]